MNIYGQQINRTKTQWSNTTVAERAALKTEELYELHISPFHTAIHKLTPQIDRGSFV